MYQLKAIVRCEGALVCASIAVSIEMNAVRSPPPDVVTANTPIRQSSSTSEVAGNAAPPATISADIATSRRRRPILSPHSVASRLDSALPNMMPLNTMPACNALNSSSVRYTPRNTLIKP